jgi:hypothetical protein
MLLHICYLIICYKSCYKMRVMHILVYWYSDLKDPCLNAIACQNRWCVLAVVDQEI